MAVVSVVISIGIGIGVVVTACTVVHSGRWKDVGPASPVRGDLDRGLRGVKGVHEGPPRSQEQFLDSVVVEGLAHHLRLSLIHI